MNPSEAEPRPEIKSHITLAGSVVGLTCFGDDKRIPQALTQRIDDPTPYTVSISQPSWKLELTFRTSREMARQFRIGDTVEIHLGVLR